MPRYVTEVVNPCLEDVHCDHLPLDNPFAEFLSRQAQAVDDILRCARGCGRVAIVTLAQHPWVLNSAAKYLPGLDLPGLLEELDIPVIYARQYLKRYVIQEGTQEGECLWTLAKQAAMTKVLRKLYGRDAPWMNVLSIGDSTVERTAIMELMWRSAHEDRGGIPGRAGQKLLKLGLDVNHTDELAAPQGTGTLVLSSRQGADPNLVDKNGETAIFYAVLKKRADAVRALLEGGAALEVINNWHHTSMSVAPTEILATLAEERKKRRLYEDLGPGPKRQRTGMEELRSWANEWPINGYAVVKNAAGMCAARLRVSEKNFVADHAQFFQDEAWFKELTPEDWCQTVGLITDEVEDAVSAIKIVVSGNKNIAGCVHSTYKPDKNEMAITKVKVDSEHMGKGLGGLLIDVAEGYSQTIGWACKKTYLSVLKANVRAQRCYSMRSIARRGHRL
eukprot:Skav232268  [mRNA]  locus=scaffold882:80726:91539:- [translate_table: standard]